MIPRFEAEAEGAPPARRDLVGSRLGAYRVVSRLGAGGMGEVYEVEHEQLGRRFALKLLRAELLADAETLARFHREPRAVAKLVSEHVVSIIDCGALNDGTPYFVMERLYGSDLRRLLNEQGVLPIARAVHLAIDACRGLACAHRQGLIHRDLKPENLFVTTRDDGQDLCKLLDFGVVKSAKDNTTRPGAIIGTTRYMAPEQLGLDLPLTPQSDLFSLGVILYECLTGRSPFDGDTVERVLFKIMTERETPLRELCPEAPEALEVLVTQALDKNPAVRPSSALAFAKALSVFVGPGTRGHAFSTWELQVSKPEVEDNSERNSTPRLIPRSVADAAATAPEAVRAKHPIGPRVFVGLAVGLAVGGAAGALLALRHAPAALPDVAKGVPEPAVTRAAPAPTDDSSSNSNLAPPRAHDIVPGRSDVPVAGNANLPGIKRKPGVRDKAAAKTAPAPSFDPQNPYAE